MKTRLFLVAVAATASLAGCGAGDPKPAAAGKGQGSEAASRKALLDFARCMRQHGVDMPDPQFSGGRVTIKQNKGNPDTARTAEKACAKFRDAVKPPETSDAEKAEFKKAALANARCMRDHGIDMPDPTFDANGGAQMRLGGGINPESAKFKAAQEACRGTLPGGGPSTTTAGEGEK
jgi:hypothetical protein